MKPPSTLLDLLTFAAEVVCEAFSWFEPAATRRRRWTIRAIVVIVLIGIWIA